MIVLDSNALIILIVGLMDPRLIPKHSRLSIYTEDDYYRLISIVNNFENLLVLPNIWAEADNLLNSFSGNHKYIYAQRIAEIIKQSTEKYISTESVVEEHHFMELGVTDSLILKLAKDAKLLITADSQLSLYAHAYGIAVYDIVEARNRDFKV